VPLPSFGPLMSYTAKAFGPGDQMATSIYFQPLTPRTTCAVEPMPMGIALASRPKLEGVAITDNVTIGLRADDDAVLTWENTPGTIAPTSYQIVLYEIVNNVQMERR